MLKRGVVKPGQVVFICNHFQTEPVKWFSIEPGKLDWLACCKECQLKSVDENNNEPLYKQANFKKPLEVFDWAGETSLN